jgi:hypothetical protein
MAARSRHMVIVNCRTVAAGQDLGGQKLEATVARLAKQHGGELDDVTDKGATFGFATAAQAEAFAAAANRAGAMADVEVDG